MITTIGTKEAEKNINYQPVSGINKLVTRYVKYTDRQACQKVYWYMLAVMVIPMVLMIPSIIAMWKMVPRFEYFVGVAMMLFFANISVHVVDMKSRVYIPLYHATIMIFITIPLVMYFITQF